MATTRVMIEATTLSQKRQSVFPAAPVRRVEIELTTAETMDPFSRYLRTLRRYWG